MKTENLISSSQSFGGWTVDSGPRVWDDHDIWTEIQDELAGDEVPQAAWHAPLPRIYGFHFGG
jgi:hypothetical protein